MLLVEHKMDMIMNLSDSIAVLQEGRVIAEGTSEEIRGSRPFGMHILGAG